MSDNTNSMGDATSSVTTADTYLDNSSRMSIPGDTVKVALARLLQTEQVDEDGEKLIWWFYSHARENNWHLKDAANAINRDPTTVHRLFNGNYGAAYDNLLAEIERYKKIADARANRRDIGFIETSTWAKIDTVCQNALYDSMPAFIYGASQIGKTACLLEFARRNNHGQSKYVRMSAAPTFQFAVKSIAEVCFISIRQDVSLIRRRVMDAVDSRTLIMIDEFHQCMSTTTDLVARKVVEFLREIYDRTGCGIVLCGTKVFRDEFERGRQALIYDQFRRRGMLELKLPDAPPKSDITKIAKAFNLPAPAGADLELIKTMLLESGIGKYIKFLQYAHRIALGRGETLGWPHFSQAYEGIKSLSK